MSLRSLIVTAWNTLRRARLIWVFALIAFGVGVIDLLAPAGPNEFVSLLRNLIVWLAGLYAEIGIIYCAAAALTHQPASFHGSQRVLGKRIFSLLLVKGIPALFFALFPIVLITAVAQGQSTQPDFALVFTWSAVINLTTLILVFVLVNPYLAYALNGIIVHNGTLSGSLRRAWRIFGKNRAITLTISLLYFGAWLLLRAATSAIYMLVQGTHTITSLGEMVGQSGSGGVALLLNNLLFSQAAEVAGLVFFTLLVSPLLQILLAQVYLHALGETYEPTMPEVEVVTPA